MKFKNSCLCLLLLPLGALAQVNIIPRPVRVSTGPGGLNISSRTRIVFTDHRLARSARYLNAYLQRQEGFRLKRAQKERAGDIVLRITPAKNGTSGLYRLKAGPQGLVISAASDTGVFYGLQTLIQLLPAQRAPVLNIAAQYQRYRFWGWNFNLAEL
ncbi:glycoside hydrolase family 20 zincin-like fold domain-containing protein [Mucilaginibacter sp. UR6-11]|uniref:glycoside hydrolase family 20 zincin-like fold domain-containing protein n=1 Tax=Mucilaginibacter sp. UR6-11 TaxID=1435644 RepID=UPI001E2F715D|nr:glycoside hydrolase family 20 zincin-like fold domain-containing protein [Mucilaginibacter sp. UR6-11]MCC8423604.1 glycoside hydrolase family 20 zincin-like fold domain-containing protein [Mucilaginibacter sp. UR6-11]